MSVHDLAESSFSVVTAQMQLFSRIGMVSAATISDIARNDFLDQPTTNKETSDKKTSLFHYLTEELHITDIMCAVQEAPATRQSNTNSIGRQSNEKKREG